MLSSGYTKVWFRKIMQYTSQGHPEVARKCPTVVLCVNMLPVAVRGSSRSLRIVFGRHIDEDHGIWENRWRCVIYEAVTSYYN